MKGKPYVYPVENEPEANASVIAFSADGCDIFSGVYEPSGKCLHNDVSSCGRDVVDLVDFDLWMEFPEGENQPAPNQGELDYKDELKETRKHLDELQEKYPGLKITITGTD